MKWHHTQEVSRCPCGQISVTFSHTFTAGWLCHPPPGPLVHCALCCCALCHPPPGPLAGGIPERKTWQTTLSQLFSSSELFAHFVNVISVEDGSHPVLKNKICPYRGYRSSSYSKYNFRLPKKKQKSNFFSTFDIRLPETNKQDKQLCVQHLKSQAVCTYGRENFESWGRKKRSIDGEPVDRYLSYIIFVKNMTFVFYVFLQLIKTVDIVQLFMSLWL